jgi:hypothetical protein
LLEIPTMAPNATRLEAPARTWAAGKARRKLDDLPGLIPHTMVADHFGIIPDLLRDWVAKGVFPRPHSVFDRTWLYRVAVVRAFLKIGKWPEGTEFRRPATRRDDDLPG